MAKCGLRIVRQFGLGMVGQFDLDYGAIYLEGLWGNIREQFGLVGGGVMWLRGWWGNMA